jgi:hypothetical protein
MILEITRDEQQQLMACIESAIKSAPSSLQAAVMLMPLAQKISQLKEENASDSDG